MGYMSTSQFALAADADRPAAWTLLADGFPQSHVDLDDPRHLEFEYVRRIGHLLDLAAPDGEPLRVLHLGGGALTLARYVAAARPGSTQLAVESDGALADLVRRGVPLGPPGPPARGGRGESPAPPPRPAPAGAPPPGGLRGGADPAGCRAGAGRAPGGGAAPPPPPPLDLFDVGR